MKSYLWILLALSFLEKITSPQTIAQELSPISEKDELSEGYYKTGMKMIALQQPDRTRENFPAGIKLLEKAAERGHTEAMFEMGNIYFEGIGVSQDEEKAIEWYGKAAAKGENQSLQKIREIFENGQGEEKFKRNNYKEAFRNLLFLAEKGNPEIQFTVSISYFNGNAAEKNQQEGLRWMIKAGENGYKDAFYVLKQMYTNGLEGARKDDKEALKWQEKIIKNEETK